MKKINFRAKEALSAELQFTQEGIICRAEGVGRAFDMQTSCFEAKVFSDSSENVYLEEYIVMEYTACGIRRIPQELMPFIWVISNEEEFPLVRYEDILIDNKKHSLIIQVSSNIISGIKLEFGRQKNERATYQIHKFYTCKKNELPKCLDAYHTEDALDYRCLDLESLYNGEYKTDEESYLFDGGRFFEGESENILNIPFQFGKASKNLIRPDAPPKENEDIILNFGVPAKRGLCRAISRDSITEISVQSEAREIFFVMAVEGRRRQKWGHLARTATILGTGRKEGMMPVAATDVEEFLVEICYADGRKDTAFPLNLVSERHVISGDMGIYAIPADGSFVEKIVFHNKNLFQDFSIAAVTINEDKERRYPDMLIPTLPEKITHTYSEDKFISLDGYSLTLRNKALSMTMDIGDGLMLLDMKNDFTPHFQVKKDYLLKFRNDQNEYKSNFKLISTDVKDDTVELVYEYDKQSELHVTMTLESEHDIKFGLSFYNHGNESIKTGIQFPSFSGMEYESNADSWYFFPKYQNLNSNESVFIYEESAPSFPMQFFDVYSPAQQGGISITTQEREQVVRKYGIEKYEEGISCYIEYPSMYGEVRANECFQASPAVVTAHSGDWRKSFEIYKKWLDSWYEPYQCQDKQWYRESFWLLAEIRDFFETEEFTKMPIYYDEETKEFNFLNILEEQKEITGVYPDILHLWGWTYRKEKNHMQWGNFGGEDYDLYDGMENFKRALHEVQDEKGVHMSLYVHPTLLSARYEQSKKFFPKYKVVNELGNNISMAGDSFRMCHANETWRDHAIAMYPRLYEELNIPLLYVDEFSLRIENRCYADSHGHGVPSNLLKTDREFISQLKETMPPEVVLYGEYAAVDVNARYIDCNISYSFVEYVSTLIESGWRGCDGDDQMGPVLTDMYRFAFPKIVQLVLPMAMRNVSWHPQKFIFFNGEAIYDSFWDCEISACQEFTVKAYKIKKKYADCFSSDYPTTMIDTLSPAICANAFPGKGRTVYTLYNRAYSTYRGSVLRVPHTEGNSYYNVWTETPAKVEIKDGYAEIHDDIGAQEIGCLLVETEGK